MSMPREKYWPFCLDQMQPAIINRRDGGNFPHTGSSKNEPQQSPGGPTSQDPSGRPVRCVHAAGTGLNRIAGAMSKQADASGNVRLVSTSKSRSSGSGTHQVGGDK